MISIDLGSGPEPKNPFNAQTVWGVDIYDTGNGNIAIADLAHEPIPFDDSSVDFVVCTDFLEHIPRNGYKIELGRLIPFNPFIHVMSEVWRVLKNDGIFFAKTPAFPRAEAFQDPTHVNIITENTQDYFAGGLLELCHAYGFKGEFVLDNQYWEGFWLVWMMRAVK